MLKKLIDWFVDLDKLINNKEKIRPTNEHKVVIVRGRIVY